MKKKTFMWVLSSMLMLGACGGNKSAETDTIQEETLEQADGGALEEALISDSAGDVDSSANFVEAEATVNEAGANVEQPKAAAPATPAAKNTSSGEDMSASLKQYEKLVDNYIDAVRKAAKGDASGLSNYQTYLSKAQELGKVITSSKSSLSYEQFQQFEKIQKKMTDAMSTFKIGASESAAVAKGALKDKVNEVSTAATEKVEKAEDKVKQKIQEAKAGLGTLKKKTE